MLWGQAALPQPLPTLSPQEAPDAASNTWPQGIVTSAGAPGPGPETTGHPSRVRAVKIPLL